MFDDDRVTQVKRLLEDYMKSPSLRHIKDEHSLHSLAVSIIERLDRESGIWIKWQGKREAVLKAAAG
jgi:hypothetical protein